MKIYNTDPENIEVGVVGLGLMGSSIIVSLLSSGHPVKAIAPIHADFVGAHERIKDQLYNCETAGLLKHNLKSCLDRLMITEDYGALSNCKLVMECVIENMEIKDHVYSKIAEVVSASAVVASNTSAISISVLQKLITNPERFIGIHWAEPAYATRFLEITCGKQTNPVYSDWVFNLAHKWNKEPTVLKKDIRGFITNRLMYAVYREIFALTEAREASIEDVDKAFRYDVGSWITVMGLFRRMDYIGLRDQTEILKNLFPKLSNSNEVPMLMQEMVKEHARGIQNQKGLYSYSFSDAKKWEKAFAAFNQDIFRLAAAYPSKISEQDKTLV